MTWKLAMPYVNNVWYHVTSSEYIPEIIEGGLKSRQESGQSTNWPVAGVPVNAIYFWPSISLARAYFGQLKFPGGDINPGKHVILRARNLDLNKIAPDHEVFAEWLEHRWNNEASGEAYDAEEIRNLYMEILSQSETALNRHQDENDNGFGQDEAYEIIIEIQPELRTKLAEELSESGDPVMYFGDVPPSQIDVAFMYTHEQLEEEFQRETDHPYPQDPETHEHLEEEYYEKLNQYMADVAGNVQIVEIGRAHV